MLLARLGSLNSLEQTRARGDVWRGVLGAGGLVPSADTLARVQSRIDPEALRELLASFYSRLRRAKALRAPAHGHVALVLDGHESTTSCRRRCGGCLVREVKAGETTRQQHYHRYAVAMLAADGVELLVDLEAQRTGEDEVAAATRLFERVVARLPRAFDVVLADALYARPSFFQAVQRLGKDALVVLKHEEWTLTQEARALAREVEPVEFSSGATRVRAWDVGDLPWAEHDGTVRVVRTEERTSVRRQLDQTTEERISSWAWVGTAPASRMPLRTVVALGHRRWGIENQGFNEAVNAWHMDHVYRHEPRAMEVMLLLAFLAFNLLHVFFDRNLQPEVRARASLQHVGRQVTAELYAEVARSRAPP